jgi:hypothetical protein
MPNKRRNSKPHAFPSSAGQMARAAQTTQAEREIQDRIASLEMTVAGTSVKRVPTSRESLQLKKSFLMWTQVCLMSLFLLAVLGVLNMKYHFLW